MSTYLEYPRAQLSFGDVCAAGFMHDSVIRRDATPLRREETTADYARKRWQSDGPVPFFVATADATDSHYLLAHGRRCDEAIVLSDDCAVETALGREGRPPKGRLFLAPVIPQQLESINSFCRFPLPQDQFFATPSHADLRRAFTVEATDVARSLQDESLEVRRSLTDEARDALHKRWAACSVRMGPVVAEDNVAKFVDALIDFGIDEGRAFDLGDGIAELAAVMWRYESELDLAGATQAAGYSPRERLVEARDALDDIDRRLQAVRTIVASLA